jgi:hypothetical protein
LRSIQICVDFDALGKPSPSLLPAWVWGDGIQLARHMQLGCTASEQDTAHVRNINRIEKPRVCLTSMLEITFVAPGMSRRFVGHGRLNNGEHLLTPHLLTVNVGNSRRGISVIPSARLEAEGMARKEPLTLNILPPQRAEDSDY